MALIHYLNTKSPYQLLNLPKELRDQIWSYVLIDHDTEGSRYATPYFENTNWRAAPDGTFKPKKRDLALLLVSKQVHKEASQIFYRKNEFRFCCFLCFSKKMWGSLPAGWDPKYNYKDPEAELCLQLHRLPSLVKEFGKFDRRQMIRHISLVGQRWWDPRALAEDLQDRKYKDRMQQYSGAVANALLNFPNLKKLDLGAGMVETFADWKTDLGQAWQPILNILRRNKGTLEVVWQDFLHYYGHDDEFFFEDEIRAFIDTYDDMEFCAETSITLPTHSALPLRETIYILSDIEREIRTIVGTTTEHIHGSRNITLDRGSEHTVYFSGVPEAFTDLFRDQENLREQLEKERCDEKGTPYREPICTCWKCVVQGRKYGPGCQCCNCVLDDSDEEQEGEEGYDSDDDFEYKPYRTIFVDEEITSEEVESVVKRAPKAFRKRWGGREPKWARKVDISIDDDDDLEL